MAALLLTTAGDIRGDTWECRSSLSDFGSSQGVHLTSCAQSCRDPPGEDSLLSAVLRTTLYFAIGKEESSPNKDRFLSLILLLKWPIWDLTSDNWNFFPSSPTVPAQRQATLPSCWDLPQDTHTIPFQPPISLAEQDQALL